MAATTPSDPYAIFIRKVGYSVGLEQTLARLRSLQERYLTDGDLTVASWEHLVEGWGLRTGNIADVFRALGFIHRTTGDVLVLDNLDAAAIAVSLLSEEEDKNVARSMILLWAILLADGELFVNFLLSDFREDFIRQRLTTLTRHKQKILTAALPGRDVARRLSRIVAIERQPTNRGSAGAGAGDSLVSVVRREPISSWMRTDPLHQDGTISPDVNISDDYFRKAPPRRKDWARTLGLWSDDLGLTARGRRFVSALRCLGYVNNDDTFIFWPMDYELIRSGFKPTLLSDSRTLWDALTDFAKAYADVDVASFSESDTDVVADTLRTMDRRYRALHGRKAMLRRELAITVAYPVSVALAAAQGRCVPDFPAAIREEHHRLRPRLTLRRSRLTGGAIAVRR